MQKSALLKLCDLKRREIQLYFDAEDDDRLTPFEDDKLKEGGFIKFKAYCVQLSIAYFKRSKLLLTKRYEKLTEEQKTQVRIMLDVSAYLSTAYFMKEDFLNILNIQDIEKQKNELNNWILWAHDCPIKRFNKCADTIRNWYNGIANSLLSSYTNGFTESCNNKIKVLKRLDYGYTNFKRFRNRILYIMSSKNSIKFNEAVV